MWELACLRKRWASQPLYRPCGRLRSLAKARQLPQGIAGRAVRSVASDFLPDNHGQNVGAGLPAKAVGQPTPLSPMRPSSQPRWGSTTPTGDRGAGCEICGERFSTWQPRSKCGSWLACESGGPVENRSTDTPPSPAQAGFNRAQGWIIWRSTAQSVACQSANSGHGFCGKLTNTVRVPAARPQSRSKR